MIAADALQRHALQIIQDAVVQVFLLGHQVFQGATALRLLRNTPGQVLKFPPARFKGLRLERMCHEILKCLVKSMDRTPEEFITPLAAQSQGTADEGMERQGAGYSSSK